VKAMPASAAAQTLLSLANGEACLAGRQEIAPLHVLLTLLKLADDALDTDHDGLVDLVAHHRADLGFPDSPVVHRGFRLHLTSPSLPPSGGGTS